MVFGKKPSSIIKNKKPKELSSVNLFFAIIKLKTAKSTINQSNSLRVLRDNSLKNRLKEK